MTLTSGQTYSVQCSQIALPLLPAQTRAVPDFAWRLPHGATAPHGVAIEWVLGCLGQLFPLSRRRSVTMHAARGLLLSVRL